MRKLKKVLQPLHRLMAFLLSLCMTVSLLFQQGLIITPALAAGETGASQEIKREADQSTMDDYKSMLDFSKNTRYAGRLWSDKTVFALNDLLQTDEDWDNNTNTLSLSLEDDGVAGTINLQDDFLHVYSVLGSSEEVNEAVDPPLDLVLLLDMSGSMATDIEDQNHSHADEKTRLEHSRIYTVLKSMNQAIDYLMQRNNVDRVAVVGYGATAYTLLDLGRYKTTDKYEDGTARYLTVTGLESYYGSTFDASGKQSASYIVKTADGLKQLQSKNEDITEVDYSKKARNNYSDSDSTKEDVQYIGYHTDLQAGIYHGFNEFIDGLTSEDVVYKFHSSLSNTDRTVQRIPIAFVMTDGGSNYALKSASDDDNPVAEGDEWFNVPIYEENFTAHSASQKKYRAENNSGVSDPKDHPNVSFGGGEAVILDILLTASYMKSKVEDTYTKLIRKYEEEKEVSILESHTKAKLSINTISVDTPEAAWQIPRVYAGLDPKDFFKPESELTSLGTINPNSWAQKTDIIEAYNAFKSWSDGDQSVTIKFRDSDADREIKFNQLPEGNEVLKDDIIKNIAYNDSFEDIKAANLTDTFQQLIESYTTPIFVPVDGANDLGVSGNSITYMDPVGKYMDVKDVKNVSVFGSLYGVTETATYSYEWNNLYQSNNNAAGGPFSAGWYLGDPVDGSNDGVTYGGSGDVPTYQEGENQGEPICNTNKEAWEKGWIYRLDAQIASQFVPSLKTIDGVDKISKKQQKTEYTFYRFESEGNTPLSEDDRKALRMNPIYGQTVPTGVKYDGENQKHLETRGVYTLADLRIWSEDTGDYTDPDLEESGSESDTNFDEALYINLPVNMLPLRTISITSHEDGTYTYKTNIPQGSTVEKNSEESAAFPIRIFYTVGMSDDLLTSDGSIDLASGVSAEYIAENKVTSSQDWQQARKLNQNDVEFFSNWYNPENRYSAYATTKTDYSYGDPMITFSPNDNNRYYIFQKALPLYSTAYVWVAKEEAWREVTLSEDYTGTEAQKFSPSDFSGRLLAQDLVLADSEDVSTSIWNALNARNIYKAGSTGSSLDEENSQVAQDGDIVLLEKNLLKDVTKSEPDPFLSDGYYYLAVDFYNLEKDSDQASPTQLVIARKGSEFGSAFHAAGITNGDMLVWHDISGTYKVDYPYVSYSETEDTSRGRDYIGADLNETGYFTDCSKDDHQLPAKPIENNAEYLSKGTWVVSAKPGGLRVGGLAQAIQGKNDKVTPVYDTYEEYAKLRFPDRIEDIEANNFSVSYYQNNRTRTANNYYVPTISTSSSAGESDIIVNTYLGNNGRLVVQDTTLLLTKMVETMSGTAPANNKKFDFQVYLAGKKGPISAVRVRYNEAAQNWQRQIHYIDMELDNKLFLQTNDGKRAVVDEYGNRLIPVSNEDGTTTYQYAVDDEDHNHHIGDPVKDQPVYYVYLGLGADSQEEIGSNETSLRVYHNQFCDVTGETVDPDLVKVGYNTVDENGKEDYILRDGGTAPAEFNGQRDFYAARALLIDINKVNEEWIFNADGEDKSIELFPLATLNPLGSEDISTVKIESPYKTQSEYLTQTLYFGYKSEIADWLAEDSSRTIETSGAEVYALTAEDLYVTAGSVADEESDLNPEQHTAEVQLESGWGLLFSSMDSGTDYGFAEKLDEDLMGEGYSFDRAEQKQQETPIESGRDDSQELPGHVYYVSGDTGAKEEEAHFYNTWSNDKSETQINGESIPETKNPMKPGVQVGDSITYNIKWANTTGEPARIVITDPLDAGVKYLSSTKEGKYFESQSAANEYLKKQRLNFTVDFGHVVIWDLGEVEPDTEGSVDLTVEVTEDAPLWWDYSKSGVAQSDGTKGNDYLVRDRATVRVNDNKYNTNTVVNPVGKPGKTEIKIQSGETSTSVALGTNLNLEEDGKYHGPQVYVGDLITYEITWRNYENKARSIKIRDPLDENVKFISAKFGDTELTDPNTKTTQEVSVPVYDEQGNQKKDQSGTPVSSSEPVISYNIQEHTVIWNLGVQASQQSGTVELVVEVLPSASPIGYVDNTAFVQIGNSWEQQTETIENPTPKVNKKETAINSNKNPLSGEPVKVDDKITYEISWDRGAVTEENLQKVVVNDPLDPGVDFISASYSLNGTDHTLTNAAKSYTSSEETGLDVAQEIQKKPIVSISYDETNHQVTWILLGKAAVPAGKVSVTVEVTKRALINEEKNRIGLPDPTEKVGTEDQLIGSESDWDYRNETGLEGNGQVQEVLDRGSVQFENEASLITELVENPLLPDKEEVSLNGETGLDTELNGSLVNVGDHIGFEIAYQNYKELEEGNQSIIVRDPLDPGVDFISASHPQIALVDKSQAMQNWNDLSDVQKAWLKDSRSAQKKDMPEIRDGIYYDGSSLENGTHTVFWVINNVAPKQQGTVGLEVRVNDLARNTWNYIYDGETRGGTGEDGTDFEIFNRATVQLGMDPEFFTSTKNNPVPDKDELNIDESVKAPEVIEVNAEGETVENYNDVFAGDEILYSITWKNGLDKKADVVITDQLDMGQGGVDFVSASYDKVDDGIDPVELKAGNHMAAAPQRFTIEKEDGTISSLYLVTIGFDESTKTVTWNIRNRAPGESGTVKLKVRVNEKARQVVDNQAVVAVGNRIAKTNILRNPTGIPSKTETSIQKPDGKNIVVSEQAKENGQGANLTDINDHLYGPQVDAGDQITYEISWSNSKEVPAVISISDALDSNVKFIQASFNPETTEYVVPNSEYNGAPAATLSENETASKETVSLPSSAEGEESVLIPVIEKDVQNNTIHWNLGTQPGKSIGKVILTVEVLPGAILAGQVDNSAAVKVDNGPEQKTNIVTNPTPNSHKTETAINGDESKGEGDEVKIEDEITYQISYQNYKEKTADIIIRDPLDKGVDFVSASLRKETPTLASVAKNNFANLNSSQKTMLREANTKDLKESITDGIYYDETSRTVFWVINNVPGVSTDLQNTVNASKGFVELTVKVNSSAKEKWTYSQNPNGNNRGGKESDGADYEVWNRASVQVDHDPELFTELVENPLPEVEKVETTPGDGEQVKVGEEIEYEISWDKSGTYGEDEELKKIVVSDPLDPGVDFVSASYDSLTLSASQTDLMDSAEKLSTHTDKNYENGYTIQIDYDKNSHKVIWTIQGEAVKVIGSVKVKVRVTSRALVNESFVPGVQDSLLPGEKKDWSYRNGSGLETQGQHVDDRAFLKFNEDPEVLTDIVRNPVIPVKEEVKPGTGDLVNLEDVIQYRIYWQNYQNEEAAVVMEDPLDTGLDFVKAEFNGTILEADGLQSCETEKTVEVPTNSGSTKKPLIRYDANTHTVFWNLGIQPGLKDGYVDLYVKVNDRANQFWQYGSGDTPETAGSNGEATDFEVVNRAGITVGNDPKIYTNVIENPTPEFEKIEINPGSGHQVMPGDQVDYAISWTNYQNQPAKITVRDSLDPGVNFKSAQFGDVKLVWNQEDGKTSAQKPKQALSQSGKTVLEDGTSIDVSISYDPVEHEIIWVIGSDRNGVPAGTADEVEFSVVVNDQAEKTYTYDQNGKIDATSSSSLDKQILNQGGITVGNDKEILTNIIPNPTEPLKDAPEINGVSITNKSDGNIKIGPEVQSGDVITYTITWQNNVPDQETGQGKAANVTVIDTFKSEGLEFISAGFVETEEGKDLYSTDIPEGWNVSNEGKTIRWTIPDQPFGAKGKVWVKARVLDEAISQVRNGAVVEVADESQTVNDVIHPLNTNTSLTVSKTVTGDEGDSDFEWHFTVSLSQKLNGKYGELTFIDGVASFTLKSGESKSAANLPEGITYKVSEAEANQDGYATTSNGEEGKISSEKEAEAAFVNNKGKVTTDSTPDKPSTPENGANVTISSDSKSANTGDNSQLGLWIGLLLFSLIGLGCVALLYRKHRD